jgi:hypothetical protein
MKGINGQPIVDMSRFLSYNEFKSLEPDILAGIAETKDMAFEGIWVNLENHPASTNPQNWKTIPEGLLDFLKDTQITPDSKPMQWYKDLGNIESRNKLTRFLKSKYGVYDPLTVFFLRSDVNFGGNTMDHVDTNDIASYFPNTMQWVESLVGVVFTEVTKVLIFYVEHDGDTLEHTDLSPNDDLTLPLDKVHKDIDQQPHFIHLRLDTSRGFYVFDPETKNKYFANSWACWFNSKEWHSATKSIAPGWSLRIDGPFTDAIKKELNL